MNATTKSNAQITDEERIINLLLSFLPKSKIAQSSDHHLIYAYMIENSMIYEIIGLVIKEFLTGEKLGYLPANPHKASWFFETEKNLYSTHNLSHVSDLRPDERANRRNAYYRMFGMDLSHGGLDGKPYPYIKPQNANTQFVPVFEAFLKELWVGYVNQNNQTGIKITDKSKIYELYGRLRTMLTSRAKNKALEKEENWYVTSMAYLFESISSTSPLVECLKAESESESGRLQKIAERVGMNINPRAVNYFKLAEPMSRVLNEIQNNPTELNLSQMVNFYVENNGVTGTLGDALYTNDILTILTHWSEATGRDLKALPTAQTGVQQSNFQSATSVRTTAIDYFLPQ